MPYAYTPDDPAQLQAIVTSPTAGAGAGILTWDKTNWLVTSYAPTAPFIVAQPHSVSVAASQSATFTVLAGGTANLSYRWYFNTNTPVPNATNAILTLANVQSANAGVYTVVITNIAGTVTSTNAMLAVSGGGSPQPQLSGLVFANGTFSLTVSGGSGGDFIIQTSTNLIDWVNLYTNLSATPFTFGDSNAGTLSQQFYRIKVGP